METMNYREKKKKSLKGPIFGIASFLVLGTGFITYAMMNEKQPVIIGNQGSLLTGNVPTVVEQNALSNLTDNELSEMFEIKINYVSDTSNPKIKADLAIPNIYIDGQELSDFNSEINSKFTNAFSLTKENMASVEHNFTYRVNYLSYANIIKDNAILSIVVNEKVIDDESGTVSTAKYYSYNIDILTGKIIKQSDIIVDILGSSYKDAIKTSISKFLDENGIISKDEYNYAYTGLENFYIQEGKLHFVFNSGEIADKSNGNLDIVIEKLENKISQEVDVYNMQ